MLVDGEPVRDCILVVAPEINLSSTSFVEMELSWKDCSVTGHFHFRGKWESAFKTDGFFSHNSLSSIRLTRISGSYGHYVYSKERLLEVLHMN